MLSIDPFYNCPEFSLHLTVKRSSKNRIDNKIKSLLRKFVFFERAKKSHSSIAHTFQNVIVCFYISQHFIFITDEKYRHRCPALHGMPRSDKSVPAILPFPCNDKDICPRNRTETMFNLLDDRAPGIFHQKKRRHSELADRQLVYCLHLLGIDERKHEYSKKENRPFNRCKNGRYKFPV